LVGQLADIAAIRTSAACQSKTAEAVAKYLAANHHDADTLPAIALNRVIAATCYDSK
jgi:hypothetical protein